MSYSWSWRVPIVFTSPMMAPLSLRRELLGENWTPSGGKRTKCRELHPGTDTSISVELWAASYAQVLRVARVASFGTSSIKFGSFSTSLVRRTITFASCLAWFPLILLLRVYRKECFYNLAIFGIDFVHFRLVPLATLLTVPRASCLLWPSDRVLVYRRLWPCRAFDCVCPGRVGKSWLSLHSQTAGVAAETGTGLRSKSESNAEIQEHLISWSGSRIGYSFIVSSHNRQKGRQTWHEQYSIVLFKYRVVTMRERERIVSSASTPRLGGLFCYKCKIYVTGIC